MLAGCYVTKFCLLIYRVYTHLNTSIGSRFKTQWHQQSLFFMSNLPSCLRGGKRLISFVLESVNNEVCTLFDVTVRCWERGFGLYGEHSGCIFKGHYFVPSYFLCLFQVECTDICRNVGIDLRRELILNFVVMSTSEFRRFIKLALLFNLILLTFSSGAVEPTSFKNRQIYRFLAEPTNAEFHCCVLNC